jgi:PPK2 family polyphosphate:nucleotide phosphotransferase
MPYAHLIDGSKKISLAEFDPEESGGLKREEGVAQAQALGAELAELTDLLYFSGQNGLLILLQGMDTSGKDGTIRELIAFMHVQSTRVESFKVPTELEADHDFLWRVHAKTPPRGGVVIFNRSHYEDVLAPRIHKLIPKEQWQPRYEHINRFEELLHDSGTMLLKFFLHISKKEQKERLLAREQETEKAWKLNVGDWKERELWGDYTAAYEELLNRCSARHAPWHLIPANHKWFRNVAVLEAVVKALRPRREAWLGSLKATGERAMAELKAYRAQHGEPP